MYGFDAGALTSIAVLGAHCDDIAIGMGATLVEICRANPGIEVYALVLTGGTGPRADEERAALAALTPGAQLSVRIEDFPDGHTPSHWAEVKQTIRDFGAGIDPQLVFGPQAGDAHQDHRQLAQLIPNEFRNQMTLGYEIVKWENDHPRPTVLIPVSPAAASAKVEALFAHYPSQVDHDWFDREAYLGLMRIRGISAKSRYAEGFIADPVIVSLPALGAP